MHAGMGSYVVLVWNYMVASDTLTGYGSDVVHALIYIKYNIILRAGGMDCVFTLPASEEASITQCKPNVHPTLFDSKGAAA